MKLSATSPWASLGLMMLAVLSFALGAVMPGATGYLLPAIISIAAAFSGWRSGNKFIRFLSLGFAFVVVSLAVVLNLVAGSGATGTLS